MTEKIVAKYSRRMDALVKLLGERGFQARKPRGSFFLYVKVPRAATDNRLRRLRGFLANTFVQRHAQAHRAGQQEKIACDRTEPREEENQTPTKICVQKSIDCPQLFVPVAIIEIQPAHGNDHEREH